MQGPASSVRVLRPQCSGTCRDSPSKGRDMLLPLTISRAHAHTHTGTRLGRSLWNVEATQATLERFFHPIYKVLCKPARFEWGPE